MAWAMGWWRRSSTPRRRLTAWVVVVAMFAGGLWRVESSARRANEAVRADRETRAEVLCPLYEVFLQTDTPQRRAATPPDQRASYDHAIGVVRAGAIILRCRFLND